VAVTVTCLIAAAWIALAVYLAPRIGAVIKHGTELPESPDLAASISRHPAGNARPLYVPESWCEK
jgi:hypothetical protein